MKDIKKYLLSLLCISMGACSTDIVEEENIFADNEEITKVVAICPQLDSDYGDSRTAVTMGSYPNGKIVWADKDTIGIYPTSGDQLSFPIVEGVGTTECVFNGGGWALKADSSYTAYSPFNRSYYYHKNKKKLPISMLGQKQVGNNNSAHLGKYDIQAAKGNKPTNGSLTFELKRKVTFVRLDLMAPKAARWTSITLKSNASFTTEASMDLSLETPTLTSTRTTTSITLELQNVNTEDSLHIVAYMACLPVDLTGKTLTVKLTDSEGVAYTSDASIVNNRTNFEANGIRWITADYTEKTVTLTEAGTLSSSLTEDEKLNLTSLVIVGSLNGDDIRVLRQMLGGSDYNETERGKLTTLDLSKATIVDGGNYYYDKSSTSSGDEYYTSNNEIGDYMFWKCVNLNYIALPENVTKIGDDAFTLTTQLSAITIPNSVTSIGNGAFSFCYNLTKVYITDLSAWCKINFDIYDNSNPLSYGGDLYLYNHPITELDIPSNITEIKNRTFDGCMNIEKVNIHKNVTSIGKGAFRGCMKMTNIVIPNNVTSIGDGAFAYCRALTNIVIPDNVISIGNSTFLSCWALESVDISNNVTSIGYATFEDCTALTSIVIPNSVTSIDESAFSLCIYNHRTTKTNQKYPSVNL